MKRAHARYVVIEAVALGRDHFGGLDGKVTEVVNHRGILIRPCFSSN